MRAPDAVSWLAGGYTSADPWLGLVVNGVLLGIPALLLLWLAWWVFRSGARPVRDTLFVWLSLGASALCAGVAYPHDPLMLIPSGLGALAAGALSFRALGAGQSRGFLIAAWVLWLPLAAALALALR
jgi:hypothetical protein